MASVSLHLLRRRLLQTPYESLPKTIHIFMSSPIQTSRMSSFHMPVSLNVFYHLPVLSSSGGLTPYSCLHLCWTGIIDSDSGYHNMVCALCCTTDIVLIMQNIQSVLFFDYSWCANHLWQWNCFTFSLYCKNQHHICFHSWVFGAWNPRITFVNLYYIPY